MFARHFYNHQNLDIISFIKVKQKMGLNLQCYVHTYTYGAATNLNFKLNMLNSHKSLSSINYSGSDN